MRLRNVRHRQWVRWARRTRRAGYDHWTEGFERHCAQHQRWTNRRRELRLKP